MASYETLLAHAVALPLADRVQLIEARSEKEKPPEGRTPAGRKTSASPVASGCQRPS